MGKRKFACIKLPLSESTVLDIVYKILVRMVLSKKEQIKEKSEAIMEKEEPFGTLLLTSFFSSYKILLDELSSTKHWASMHVSDHSGFHYRQFLLKSLISQTVIDSSVMEQNPLRSEPALVLPKDEEAAVSTEEPRINLHHLLEEEVEFSTDLIDSYPGHETLWCHR